jgi:hypothetical protein
MAWANVRGNLIRQSFRACGITSSNIDEFNAYLRECMLWVDESQTISSGTPIVSDFSLPSSPDSNPCLADGVFYRSAENEMRVILAIGPRRDYMCLRNN